MKNFKKIKAISVLEEYIHKCLYALAWGLEQSRFKIQKPWKYADTNDYIKNKQCAWLNNQVQSQRAIDQLGKYLQLILQRASVLIYKELPKVDKDKEQLNRKINVVQSK